MIGSIEDDERSRVCPGHLYRARLINQAIIVPARQHALTRGGVRLALLPTTGFVFVSLSSPGGDGAKGPRHPQRRRFRFGDFARPHARVDHDGQRVQRGGPPRAPL